MIEFWCGGGDCTWEWPVNIRGSLDMASGSVSRAHRCGLPAGHDDIHVCEGCGYDVKQAHADATLVA